MFTFTSCHAFQTRSGNLLSENEKLKAYSLCWLLAVSSEIFNGSILSSLHSMCPLSRTHPGTFICPLYLRSWVLELYFDGW